MPGLDELLLDPSNWVRVGTSNYGPNPYADTGLAQFRGATGQAPIGTPPPSTPQTLMDFLFQNMLQQMLTKPEHLYRNALQGAGALQRGQLSTDAPAYDPALALSIAQMMMGRMPIGNMRMLAPGIR